MGTWGARAAAFVGAAGLTVGFAGPIGPAGAATSTCGRSFIDLDNNGVCSPGDINLAPALAGLAQQHNGNSIDTGATIVSNVDGSVIYTPPADNHPVGVVLGGSITLGIETDFSVYATGAVHFNGRIFLNNDASLEAHGCGAVDFGKGSRMVETGNDDTFVDIQAVAWICGSNDPQTMHFSTGSRFQTNQFMRFTADNMVLDNHVQFQGTGTQPTIGANGDIELHSGNLTLGKSDQFVGTAGSEIDVDNCGPNVTADHLQVNVGVFDWENTNYGDICNELVGNGYINLTDQPQRITITHSRFAAPNGGFVWARGNGDGTYPCDAMTLIKTVNVQGNTWFAPTPRINPTGACTGTITG